MRHSRTHLLAFVSHLTSAPWEAGLRRGIEQSLRSSHMNLVVNSLLIGGYYDDRAARTMIREHRVDGLILAPVMEGDQELLACLRDSGMPAVFISPDPSFVGRYPFVQCRNREAGKAAAQHLLELGHRRIAFFGGPESSSDTQERLAGFRSALASHAGLPEPEISFSTTYAHVGSVAFARNWLIRSREEAPTAIAFGNDALALGFMRVVLEKGIQIPKDVSVLGFDGVPEGELIWPSLTTVRQPLMDMGAGAVRLLLEELETPGHPPMHLDFEMKLIPRESTGPWK